MAVYLKSVLSKKIRLLITEVGENVKENLKYMVTSSIEGKCIAEGFIKPDSVKIISYSSGNVNAEYVEFQTVFECLICYPVEGMILECVSKTITKAGIHSEVVDSDNVVPVTVFVARDHHNTNKYFNTIKENAKIQVKVIGVRYELNDPYICAIGKLVDSAIATKNPKIKIGGNIYDDDDEDDDE